MKVILTVDIKNKGKKNDIIDVNDGYARNFLLPQKKAIIADNKNLAILNQYKSCLQYKTTENEKKAIEIKNKLESKNLFFNLMQGMNNKIFGQITNIEIKEKLKSQYSIEIDKHKILIDKPINNIGTFNVKVKLYPNLYANIKIVVNKINKSK